MKPGEGLMEDDKTFLFTYSYQGAKYEMKIKAANRDEAEARMKAARYAEFTGELIWSTPIPLSKKILRALRVFRKEKP